MGNNLFLNNMVPFGGPQGCRFIRYRCTSLVWYLMSRCFFRFNQSTSFLDLISRKQKISNSHNNDDDDVFFGQILRFRKSCFDHLKTDRSMLKAKSRFYICFAFTLQNRRQLTLC
jgi:hypothetical protein